MNAVTILKRYSRLQRALIKDLMATYKPADLTRFSDIKSGFLNLEDGTSWRYARHGIGVSFTSADGVVVDAHVGMLEHPDAFDAWRIEQFFESTRVSEVEFNGMTFSIEDEKSIEKLLSAMANEGTLEQFVFNTTVSHPLYRFR